MPRTHHQLRTRGFAACVEPTVQNHNTMRVTDDRGAVDCLRCLRWLADRDQLEARRPRRRERVAGGFNGVPT